MDPRTSGRTQTTIGGELANNCPSSGFRVSMMIKISKRKWLGGHGLRFRFSDGPAGEHDFSALVAESGPMVEPLRDPAYFSRVFLEDGAPTWPNGYDMAPSWVQMELEAAGELRSDAA